jgi:hypothetical protein
MKKSIKLCFAIVLTFAMSTGVQACSSASSNSDKTDVKEKSTENVISGTGTIKTALDKAKSEGKAVFLVITSNASTGNEGAVTKANEANKLVKKSTVIQINKDETANSDVVASLGIAGVPAPFILVISPKGIATGGYAAANTTADMLVKLIPSPKNDEVLLALSLKKPVFIVASKSSFTDKLGAVTNCKTAAAQLTNPAAIVEIDMADTKEAAFMKQLGINTLSTTSVTIVVNSTGNVTGNFTGVPTTSSLTTAANKVVKSCCPSGSSSGCGTK